jgi:DNA replication licensing factor MCM5
MDRQSVYTTHTFRSNFDDSTDTRIQLQEQLEAFILNFRLDNNYVYRFGARLRACTGL